MYIGLLYSCVLMCVYLSICIWMYMCMCFVFKIDFWIFFAFSFYFFAFFNTECMYVVTESVFGYSHCERLQQCL